MSTNTPEPLIDRLRRAARPLNDDADLDLLIKRIGDARVVMLGEASHGTSEYYTWRDRISRRLIRECGFSFIAVEGDWPDCYTVNRFVKHRDDARREGATRRNVDSLSSGRPGGPDHTAGPLADPDADQSRRTARDVLHAFARWPTWMWANEEVVELTGWLRDYNSALEPEARIGFYGLDVYSLWDSMHAVLEYLDRIDPDAARSARRAYGCFDPYHDDAQEYAMATAVVPTSCEDATIEILARLRRNAPQYREDGHEAYFNAEQNALIARNAELYYRTMVRGGPASWNVRDTHMAETLERLLEHHGPDAKAIVWEHNTHIGDARATDMARAGMTNIGQIVRETRGRDDVVLVGFAGYEGSVIAGSGWGEPMRVMEVPPARPGSWEALLHQAVGQDSLLLTADLTGAEGAGTPRDHRAIGVVYHPDREQYGNYVPTVLPARYDALLHIEHTRALQPLHMRAHVDGEAPETYPTGE